MIRQNRRFSLRVLSQMLWAGCFALAAHGDELWVAPTYQPDLGGLGIASNAVWPATPIGAVRLAWGVPDNLKAFQSAKMVLIPHSPGGAADLTVYMCPAQSGDPAVGACTGPFTHSFIGVANELLEIDISASLAPQVGLAGVTNLAVLAFTAPTTGTDHIVGLRFAYEPTAPSGVATLGANAFSGTQTAPAFVGDGSGLTNLPAPSGVATLGANTFSGTQTAPAFVGDGSGLTNLPFPAGAATLGANLFAGTQAIDAGNLDLDFSTATSGQLTQNGAPLLHTFGAKNLFLGGASGNFSMTGESNIVLGLNVLGANTTGSHNTATGVSALAENTSGSFNTALGRNALRDNSTANGNTATGFDALRSNTTGIANTAAGSDALELNVTGAGNTAIGVRALGDNTDGSNNTALGSNALDNTLGDDNVGVGFLAGVNATTGSNNIYLGTNVRGVAGESNTIYLGRVGTQTKTVIAGVRGTAVDPDALPVVIDSAGQLGTIPAFVTSVSAGTGLLASGPPESPTLSVAAGEVTGNHILDRSLTGQDLAPGAVGSFEIATGAVTSSELANNSVTGSHIVGNTIQHFDVADEAGVEFAGANQIFPVPPGPVVVRSVTMSTPSSGYVSVVASGSFVFTGAGTVHCSITTGTTVFSGAEIRAGVIADTFLPFAGTRGFTVSEGTVTLNLVCEAVGVVAVRDSHMTAIFAPTRY